MGKPVDKIEFWKERLGYPEIRYSVYLTNKDDWDLINKTHKEILKELRGKVLDAGCGYGRASEWIEDYTGIDFSPDFIEKAKELYPDKDFRIADLKDLPFKDKEFDWAFCISVKKMIQANLGEDIWDIMEKELKRVAKKVLILEYSEPDKHEII